MSILLQGLTGTPVLCTLPDCLGRLDYLCRRLLGVRLASVPLAAGVDLSQDARPCFQEVVGLRMCTWWLNCQGVTEIGCQFLRM